MPEEVIVGCQVFYAYSTQKVFVWPYLLLRLLGKAQSIGNAVLPCGSSQQGRDGQGCPRYSLFLLAGRFPWSLHLPVLEGEGRTYTCKHGLLLSWSCRAIHHQFDMCIYFSVGHTQYCHCFVLNVLLTSLTHLTEIIDGVARSL